MDAWTTPKSKKLRQAAHDADKLSQVAALMDQWLRVENHETTKRLERQTLQISQMTTERTRLRQDNSLAVHQLEMMDNELFRLEGLLLTQVGLIDRLQRANTSMARVIRGVLPQHLPPGRLTNDGDWLLWNEASDTETDVEHEEIDLTAEETEE